MTILTRYIAGAYLKILGLCLASFVAIYLVIDFLEKIGRLLRFQPRWIDIIQYFICKLPEIITQVIPLAVLMSTLLTLGMLSRNSEIVAMRGCGVGLGRISAPLIVIAAAVSLITIFFQRIRAAFQLSTDALRGPGVDPQAGNQHVFPPEQHLAQRRECDHDGQGV